MHFGKPRGIGPGLSCLCGLLAACAPSGRERAGEVSAAENSRIAASAPTARRTPETVTPLPERSGAQAGHSGTTNSSPTDVAEGGAAGGTRAKTTYCAILPGGKRGQLARPTDFAKLTEELRRKQSLDAALDEAAVRAELGKRALAGDSAAALTLGLMLRYGDTATDKTQGERLIAAAADAGNARAMAELGRLLLTDETRADGPAQAEAWLRKAWAAGESEGAFLLASAQRLKLLEPAAEESTGSLLLAAAEQGNEAAQRLMMYLNGGIGMPGISMETEERWSAALANSGDVSDMYGHGVWLVARGNPSEGRKWIERAAASGSIQAVDTLARLDPAAVRDPRTLEALIAHLKVLATDPAADSAFANFTLAQYIALRGDSGAARTEEVLKHLKAAASQRNYHAGLAAIWIESGRDVRDALAEVRAMDDATAYARYVQASQEPSDESPGTSSAPVPLVTPQPAYPVELRAAGTTGVVTVAFIVDETGAVRDPQIISSDHPALSAAVLEAIPRWSFRPALKDGVAVATRTQIVIPFKLRE